MTLKTNTLETLVFLLVAIGFFLMVVLTRPLLPVDETRYVSVAWEMWLRGDFFAPLTMNFEPYSHKPPLLFWFMNLCWSVFGVSRWAATIPTIFMAFANVFLISYLHRKLFPNEGDRKSSWILLGNIPFLIYSTLILFDLTLTVFVQIAILCLLSFSKEGRLRWMVLMGLTLGVGLLTKGPVAYLYVAFPLLLGPLWNGGSVTKAHWYKGVLVAFLFSIPPILLWLIPVLKASDDQFAFWLVWNQTAGRVTGNFSSAHNRGIYFYFMFLPVIVLPWVFFPSLWRNVKNIRAQWRVELQVRFLLLWIVPTFLCFCLIKGKQPHYLVPLLIPLSIYIAHVFRDTSKKLLVKTAVGVISLFVLVHFVAVATKLKDYDLRPIASKLMEYKDRDLAFVNNYHAELGFLARLEHPVKEIKASEIKAWFEAHPHGIIIMKHEEADRTGKVREIISKPYRGRNIGLFERLPEP